MFQEDTNVELEEEDLALATALDDLRLQPVIRKRKKVRYIIHSC